MTRQSFSLVFVLVIALALVVERRASGNVSGNANPSIAFEAEVRGSDGKEQYRFTIDIEPVIFRLLTVQNKFSLVRLRMQNSTSSPLALSVDNDRLDLVSKSAANVSAVLNLQHGDSVWWDGLDARMRETLAYPVTLKGVPAPAGNLPVRSPESLYFYAFFPASAAREVPEGFAYTVASLGQTIRIAHRGATAR